VERPDPHGPPPHDPGAGHQISTGAATWMTKPPRIGRVIGPAVTPGFGAITSMPWLSDLGTPHVARELAWNGPSRFVHHEFMKIEGTKRRG
jgi:hypothetical protein